MSRLATAAASKVDTEAYAALQQAAEWYAALHGASTDAREKEQWQRWLDAAPSHRAAWQKIEAVNQQFGALPAEPAHAALRLPPARRAAARKLLFLAGSVALGTLAARRDSRDYVAALAADERTAVGEMRQLTLADGSRLWINTASAVDIDYAAGLRRIVLHRGEILLHSGADQHRPRRPLVVDGRHGRLTALGTRFSVWQEEDGGATRLAVYEGAVCVKPERGGASHVALTGTQLRFGADWIGDPQPCDEAQSAWTRGRLSADRMRLDEFLATLARYRRGHLGCHPAVAGLRLTGSYPLDDTDRILGALEASLPVRANRLLPWWTTIEPRA